MVKNKGRNIDKRCVHPSLFFERSGHTFFILLVLTYSYLLTLEDTLLFS